MNKYGQYLDDESRNIMFHAAIDERAYAKVYEKYKMRVIEAELQAGKGTPELLKLFDKLQKVREGRGTKYLWVTVNPKEQDDIVGSLNFSIVKLQSKKWVKSIRWTFEQRGEIEEEMGKGIHLHMLVERCDETKRLDSARRTIHDIFDKWCGSTLHVKINRCYDNWVEDKIQYLQGNKWDDEKDDKISMDKLWRESIGIQSFYSWVRS